MTGERVRLSTGRSGRPVVAVLRATQSGVAAVSSTVEVGGDEYVIPAIARPYLGRFLDPALFDVTALAKAGASARLPVALTFTGVHAPVLPGVTMTSSSAGVERGYLTPTSAKAFGAALASQYLVDAAHGWPSQSALFAGVGRVSADIATSPPVAVPAFPMRTLIINVLDGTGAPVPFTFVQMLSVDDPTKFNNFVEVVDGQARISVPLGTYAGLVEIDTMDSSGLTGTSSVVPFDDYVVKGMNQTLTLDARTARSTLSARVPRPAVTVSQTWEWDRAAAGGQSAGQFDIGVSGGFSIRTAPVRPPAASLGTLNSVASWSLASPPAPGPAYTYDLAFPSSGVPANQGHVVTAGSLATVNARYFSDAVTGQGGFGRGSFFPFQFATNVNLLPLALPTRRVEFVQALPSGAWTALLLPNEGSMSDPFAGAVNDGLRLARGGTSGSVDWMRNPLAPGVPYATDGDPAGLFACPVCRTATSLQVFLAPVTDTTPGHEIDLTPSSDGTQVARFRLFRNGVLLADQPDSAGGVFPVPASSATYQVIEDVNRVPSGAFQSLTTSTELTFRSSGSSGGAMPGSWFCLLAPACTVPALLQAGVQLPVNLHGAVPLGSSTIGLTLGHIQGAVSSAITAGSVQVRIGTGSWTSLPTTSLGGGRYRFLLTTTAAQAGDPVDLRVSGTDAAGGQIVQTTSTAFTVSEESK